jgi:HD-like signal output (HDOD) protein
MTDNSKTLQLLEEMRSKGNLPAINENVQAITQITRQSHTRAVDLASVIMRDCGLTSNILATANSVLYRPRYPIKTVTYAVTFLGFEKVRTMALGLSIFNQAMKTAILNHSETAFQLPHLQKRLPFRTAMISPIITMGGVIGAYFIARTADIPFSEKEIAWFEQVVVYVGQAFEKSKKQS